MSWVKQPFYRYDQIDEAFDREYTWRIVVVKGTPGKPKSWSTSENPVWDPGDITWQSDPSTMWTLYVEPGDGPPPNPDGNDKEKDKKTCTRC